ncbi:MAG TPA: hypothetical protein VEB18_00665 [Candidatus Paceibacterota bacterium]|nr:hypothetical protein [Candidatus Paceibacterota bacterium]
MSHQNGSSNDTLAAALAEPSPLVEARELLTERRTLLRQHEEAGLKAFGGIANGALASLALMVVE